MWPPRYFDSSTLLPLINEPAPIPLKRTTPLVQVPGVVGIRPDYAGQILTEKGLYCDYDFTENYELSMVSNVLSQEPEAYTEVPRGSVVRIYYEVPWSGGM
ncbi:PASTA domain-containing protein [Peribacillus butanolivorans]|uniref:PASTA domain-containing protein n=1 Tax=Peribacillus butanolivorans TaxID=421767 RepID=UPI0036DD5716